MPNCSAPIAKTQKKLLRVLNCLFQQYILCQTPSTKAFFAAPSVSTYASMSAELGGLAQVINATALLAKLSTTAVTAKARILVCNAEGTVAYDSALTSADNTYPKYTLGTVNSSNFGTRKGIQQLNVDECAVNVYQVKPTFSHFSLTDSSSNKLVVTGAAVTERTGCPGVSNTGFLRLSIEVDITAYPFNACQCNDCESSSSSH